MNPEDNVTWCGKEHEPSSQADGCLNPSSAPLQLCCLGYITLSKP